MHTSCSKGRSGQLVTGAYLNQQFSTSSKLFIPQKKYYVCHNLIHSLSLYAPCDNRKRPSHQKKGALISVSLTRDERRLKYGDQQSKIRRAHVSMNAGFDRTAMVSKDNNMR